MPPFGEARRPPGRHSPPWLDSIDGAGPGAGLDLLPAGA
jgi:hypothetical protein